jgi:hypothetical protein
VKGAVEQAGVEFLGEGFSHGVQLKPRLGPIDIQDSHV